MSDITLAAKGAPVETPGQRPQSLLEEPKLPRGSGLTGVQTQPLPLLSHVEPQHQQAEHSGRSLALAQSRADMNGLGAIVDVIV